MWKYSQYDGLRTASSGRRMQQQSGLHDSAMQPNVSRMCTEKPRYENHLFSSDVVNGSDMFKDISALRVLRYYCHVHHWSIGFIHSYSFISTTVDKTQLWHRAKMKLDSDRTEKKVNVQCRPNTLWVKKQDTELLPITSPNIDRFSKFVHY